MALTTDGASAQILRSVDTTGSSDGIGRVTAEYFANRGGDVAATARRPETIEVRDNMSAFRLDVTDEESIAAAVSATVERFGTIDVLINNAGLWPVWSVGRPDYSPTGGAVPNERVRSGRGNPSSAAGDGAADKAERS